MGRHIQPAANNPRPNIFFVKKGGYPLDLTVSWDELRELYTKDEYQIDTARDAMLHHLYKPIMYRNRKVGEIKSISEED